MYTFVTRNVDANKLEAGNIQPITHVKIENDPEKQIKGEKLFLYNGDKCLGCLAVEESSLLPGTKSAKELTEEDIVGHALMSRRRCSKDYTFCKMELFLAKDILEKAEDTAADQKNNNQIVLLFGGTRTTCPGKGELLKRLDAGEEVECDIMRNCGDIVAQDAHGRICGKLYLGQAQPDLFAKRLSAKATARAVRDESRWEELLKASSSKKKNEVYEVVIQEKPAVSTGSYEEQIEDLNNRCIAHPADVKERIAYLEGSGISEALIRSILDSYIEYSANEFQKIRKPTQPFIDYKDGYLQRSIAYMLTGQNIRLVGSKGCGKNTMLDTLSWIFNQPLYKIGCSERTDEYTIFGSTQIKNGDTIHRLSPFAHGLTVGAICILDEANMAPPELLSAINQLTDDTREVDINNYGKLRLHDRTIVFMTMNEDYQGTCQMNDATLDRFQGIFMDSEMNPEALFESMVPEAKKEHIRTCCKIYNSIYKQYRNGELPESALTIRGYIAALKASALLPLKACLYDSLAGRMQNADDRESIKTAIDSFCEV